MNLITRILILDKNEELLDKMKSMHTDAGMEPPEIKRVMDFNGENLTATDCIIIDAGLIKDIKGTVTELKKSQASKIILVYDTLNNPVSQTAALLGADICYKYASMTALLNKIYSSGEISREVPDRKDIESIRKEQKQKVIAVSSSKGGTGKTTLSINIAIQYARKSLKVLLLDMAQCGNIGLNFKIVHRGTGLSGIVTAMENAGENLQLLDITGMIRENSYKYEIEGKSIDIVISASPIKMEGIGINEIEVILRNIRKMDYDIVIIDTSAELSQRNLAILELVDEIILMASPDLACGWNLLQMKDIIKSLGIKSKISIVVNGYLKTSGFFCKELETELEYPLICIIPNCVEVQLAANTGQPIGINKKHWINVFYRRIAHQILPVFNKKEIKLSRFGFF